MSSTPSSASERTGTPPPAGSPRGHSAKKKGPNRAGDTGTQAGEGRTPLKEPVVLGVAFYDEDETDGPVCCVSREGNYIFDRHEAAHVKQVILESARFLGYDIPDMFIPMAAEVFYDEVKLVKMRLAGKYVDGVDSEGAVYKMWQTPESPQFTVSPDYKLRVAEEDRNMAYIAMLNYESGVWFSWNLSPHYDHDMRPTDEVNQYILKFRFHKEKSEGGEETSDAAIISEAEELLKDVPVEGLQEILMPKPPVDVSDEQLAIKMSDPFRRLTYIYDREEVKYRLGARYAHSVKFNEEEIRRFAEVNSFSFNRAKAVTFLLHQKYQKAFVEENMTVHHQKTVELLKYTFTNSLIQEVNTAVLADWNTSLVVKDQRSDDLKDLLIGDAIRDMKERLGRTGQGRPEKSTEEVARENAERVAAIKEEMRKIFQEARDGGADVFAAEKAVSAKAVYTRLEIAKSTFYEWLENCGLEFAKLRREVIAA